MCSKFYLNSCTHVQHWTTTVHEVFSLCLGRQGNLIEYFHFPPFLWNNLNWHFFLSIKQNIIIWVKEMHLNNLIWVLFLKRDSLDVKCFETKFTYCFAFLFYTLFDLETRSLNMNGISLMGFWCNLVRWLPELIVWEMCKSPLILAGMDSISDVSLPFRRILDENKMIVIYFYFFGYSCCKKGY